MAELPDIESLSQQIAKLHLQGDLILDPEPVGKHIRRVTIAQLINVPVAGPEDLLVLGGRECKYVEVVANVACVARAGSQMQFTLDDGFGRMDAWLPLKREQNQAQQKTVSSLMPFDYAHIEGKVRRPAGSAQTIFEVISIRRLQTGYEIWLHLLQVLSEIDETIKDSPPAVTLPSKLPKHRAGASVKKTREAKAKDGLPLPSTVLQTESAPQGPSISVAKRVWVNRSLSRPTPSAAPSGHPKALGKHILRYFRKNVRAATSQKGIAVHDGNVLEYLMHEQNMIDLTTQQFLDAVEYLIEEGYIYATIDEFHYRLLTT